MKVLRIVSELDFGGVEQVALNSFPELHEKVELQVLVLSNGGRISGKLERDGISIKVLNKNPRIPNFKLIQLIRTEIQVFQPEVMHCQGVEANFHGILSGHLAGVSKIIGEEIGIPNHHSYWKYIFKWVYSKANLVIAISEAVKKEIVRLGEVSPGKVRVLYNPVFFEGKGNREKGFEICQDTGEDKEKADKSFVFVTTCRLVPIKNLGRLIEAFGGLVRENSDKSLRLRIVGDGPERENLEKEIRDKGLENRVEILGFQEDIWPFLFESDIFILPSLREGSSVSLAEAMTVGLPSIVTQIGGASEILGESQSGFLIDPLDSNSIQSAMQQMLDLSQEERHAMGQRAKKESQRFSVENYLKELMKVYAD
jgi:glycosyltransferase involved in cell wall biosynthesis